MRSSGLKGEVDTPTCWLLSPPIGITNSRWLRYQGALPHKPHCLVVLIVISPHPHNFGSWINGLGVLHPTGCQQNLPSEYVLVFYNESHFSISLQHNKMDISLRLLVYWPLCPLFITHSDPLENIDMLRWPSVKRVFTWSLLFHWIPDFISFNSTCLVGVAIEMFVGSFFSSYPYSYFYLMGSDHMLCTSSHSTKGVDMKYGNNTIFHYLTSW